MTTVRSPLLIGRNAEIERICRGLDEARAGRGGLIFMTGEAGSGKTRLMAEAMKEARRRQTVTLASSSPSIVAPLAFGVLADAFRSWLRSEQLDASALETFAVGIHHILPEWPLPKRVPRLTPDQTRLLVLEGALRLLLSAGKNAGALLALDDLHAADPETVQFVSYASSIIPRENVLILASLRLPQGRALEVELRALERRGLAMGLDLAPLTQDQIGAMIQAIFGATAPPRLLQDVVERTDGVPLLVEEVLNAYLTEGSLRRQESALYWSRSGSSVPRTILELVRAKLSSLSEAGRAVVSAAALLERPQQELLLRVASRSSRALGRGTREAIDAGLLEAADGNLRFRHSVIRESVDACLLPTERRELHRRAARAIADLFADDPGWMEERALHLERCGERDGSAAILVDLARRSLALHGPASAEAALRRAISLAQSEHVQREAGELLAETLRTLGRWDESLRTDSDLVSRFGETPARLARMARTAAEAGRLDDADSYLSRASHAGASPGPLDALRGLLALWRGNLDEAISASRDALRQATVVTDAELACRAYDVLGRALDARGRRTEAAAAFDQWAGVAAAAGLTASQLQALMERGNLDFLSGGPSDRLDQARSLAAESGVYLTYVLATLSLLWWYGRRDRIGEAIRLGDEAVEACRHFGLDLLPHALAASGWAHNLRRCGEGEPLLDEALKLAQEDLDLRIICAWARGEAFLRSGRFGAACEQLESAARMMAEVPSSPPTPAPFQLPVALLLRGDKSQAIQALAAARTSPALDRQYVNALWLEVSESLLSGSAERFEAAISPFRTSARYDYGWALLAAAEALPVERRPIWLLDAARVFEGAGAETDQERARSLMRAHGMPVPRARARAAAGLPHALREKGVTAREAEVLDLIGQGLTNGEIAGRLFISVRTVETHVSALLRKLDAEGRPALIALSLGLGTDRSARAQASPTGAPAAHA